MAWESWQGETREEARTRRFASANFVFSVAVIAAGIQLAAQRYPGIFDWQYTVVSALAAKKHNPEGAVWFASALSVAMLLLWPVTTYARRVAANSRAGAFFIVALRVGLVAGFLVGVERVFIFHLSNVVRKGHEILALSSFLGLYTGVLGVYVQQIRRSRAMLWAVLGVVLPLAAIGVSQLYLFLSQRDLGWVGADWRARGIPIWMSFAFWQWLSVGALWASIGGILLLPAREEQDRKAALDNR